MTAPSLQIQSVLFNNESAHVERFVQALGRAMDFARSDGTVGATRLVLGDCSPGRVLEDEVLERLREEAVSLGIDEISYLFFDANLGSAAGHNALFEELASDYVLIINPDTIAAPGLVTELFKPFAEQDRVGLVEARQLPFEHPKAYDARTGETGWSTTACALVPKVVVDAVGGFDNDSFFLYCDDVDWSWRIRLAGYRLIMRDSARIFHDKRLNADGTWMAGGAEEYYSAEAALIMAHKWGRPDLVQKYSRELRTHGTEPQARAVDEYEQRRDDGRLPDPIEGAGKVATFVDGAYSVHRF